MDHAQQGRLIGYAIGGAIFLLVFGLRMRRMMQSRPYNIQYIWILPAILVGLTVLTLMSSPPVGREWLWLAGSCVVGAGLGWFRAKTIRLTVDPTTRRVMAQGSPLAMAFLIVIFAIRFGLRGLMMSESATLGLSIGLVETAFLAMASGLFIARAVEMGVRATRLINQTPVPTPAT